MFRSATAIAAPARARRLAMASPMPVAAPVTMAVWPVSSNAIGALFFFRDDDGDFGWNFAVQPHRHLVLAQLLDWLIEVNLAAIDGEILLLEGFGDVLGGDRSEELIVLSCLLRYRHRDATQ